MFGAIGHSSLTCDVDLDFQAVVLVDRHRGPLGDHTALDGLWHDGPYSAGGGGAGVGAGVAGATLTGLGCPGHLLHRDPQEVPHKLKPVEYEEHS